MALHQRRTHPDFVPGCFACRVSAVQVAPSATPTRAVSSDVAFQKDFATEFVNGDREAYKRLRQSGLQPPRIRGSAHLERHATTRFEVETGRIYDDKTRLNESLKVLSEAGVDPLKPSMVERTS